MASITASLWSAVNSYPSEKSVFHVLYAAVSESFVVYVFSTSSPSLVICVSAISKAGYKTLSRCWVIEAISFYAEEILSSIGPSMALWSPSFSLKSYLWSCILYSKSPFNAIKFWTSSSRGPSVAIYSSSIARPSCPQEVFESRSLAFSDDKVLMSVYTARVLINNK